MLVKLLSAEVRHSAVIVDDNPNKADSLVWRMGSRVVNHTPSLIVSEHTQSDWLENSLSGWLLKFDVKKSRSSRQKREIHNRELKPEAQKRQTTAKEENVFNKSACSSALLTPENDFNLICRCRCVLLYRMRTRNPVVGHKSCKNPQNVRWCFHQRIWE